MSPYHVMFSHFPLALWATAALIILMRAVSECGLSKACDKILTPLLGFATLMAVITIGTGYLIWDIEAIKHSPLARNHLLFGIWSSAYWALIWFMRWKLDEACWKNITRWIMLTLAIFGLDLLAITGTLGGHLSGGATFLSEILKWFGWDVYTTFYLPNAVLVLLVVASIILCIMGWKGKNRDI
jgi:hypothetical protein